MRTSVFIISIALLVAAGCSSSSSGPCEEAEARLGYRVCVEHVGSTATWSEIEGHLTAVDQVGSVRYLVPAGADARLPTVFEDDAAPSRSHYEFLTQGFPDLFPGLALDDLDVLTTDPFNREFFAGIMTEYITPSNDHVYGYLVWDRQDSAGTISCAEAKQVQTALSKAFAPAPLVIVPATSFQRTMLASCDVPSYDASQNLPYEPYNEGVSYGTVRRYTLTDFQQAAATFSFGWQDIIVVDEAPIDIETVIAGVVTGTRQGELSHLNVRSANRGTPNCYSRDVLAQTAAWEGKLVRFECSATELRIAEATPEEAQAWWDSYRPPPVKIATPDWGYTALTEVHAVPTSTAGERAIALTRFGGKGHNLATLYQRIRPELQMPAFLIPFAPYRDFMVANGLDQLLAQDLADPQFQSNGVVRQQKLTELRNALLAAPCDAAIVASVSAEIASRFGANVMVRFRSSSNAEDGLLFNGAGLYSSTSACVADDTDGDAVGPSQCDATKSNEHGVCIALKKVWSSLWLQRAYEERTWYGIDQSAVAMSILVDLRSKDELANVVAFSGNPLGPNKDDYLIDAQIGAYDVVSAIPGVYPEKDLLTMSAGQVQYIQRVRASSQLPAGQLVLDDGQLAQLGAYVAEIVQQFPIDDGAPAGHRIILDTEWKVRADGTWLIKQVRPFLD